MFRQSSLLFRLCRLSPLWLVPLLLWCVACAQDLPDINRVQPRAVDKAIFRTYDDKGKPQEWFFRQTVIDVPYGSNATFVGEQGETERVLWEITENFLYAYRSYEYIKGSEKPYQRSKTGGYRGAAVAAFRIESHFDIQRSFNAATGEQTNVIVENSSDRPWHQRKHMRVDFTKNLVADFRFVGSLVKQQAIGYYVPETETKNKDRAKIGEGYIDIVHKLYIEPQVDPDLLAYWGEQFPICWLESSITHDCLGQTIKIRSAFSRIKPRSYVTKLYDNQRMDKFGFFRSTRYSFDPKYGVTEKGTQFMANLIDIWKDAKACTDAKATQPYRRCEVRQLPFYVNEQFPDDLKIAARRVMAQWNKLFAEMVTTLTGKSQADVFVLCENNPVKDGDPALCGKAGTNPQIGDLRYHMLYWVTEPHRVAPLGYGPAAIDPLSGEMFSVNAFVYGAEIDRYAARATDIVRLVHGDLKTSDIADAKHIATYYKNRQSLQKRHQHHWHPGHRHRLGKLSKFLTARKRFRHRLKTGAAKKDWVALRLRRLRRASNTEQFFPGDIFKAFGLQRFSPDGQINDQIRKRFGMHVLGNRSFLLWSKRRMLRLAQKNIMMGDFVDDSILARALALKRAYLKAGGKVDYTQVYKKLREDVFLSTALHEVGHVLGLRHNFAASSDALNYFDQYWDLRGTTIPKGAKGPIPEYRYSAKDRSLLQDAVKQGMREYQYSSIMDYGANFASDLRGLGKYDRAAILYGYGDLIEVFKPGATTMTPDKVQQLEPGEYHYTQIPALIGGVNKSFAEQRKAMVARELVSLNALKTRRSLVPVPYRFCSDEYYGGSAHCYAFDQGADAYERVSYFTNSYWNYYIFDAFKRNRVVFGDDVYEYMSTIYGRYFMPIADQYKHFVNSWWFLGYGTSCGGENWFNDPKCGEHAFFASVKALNFFARVLQTPDLGCYRRKSSETTKAFQWHSVDNCPSDGSKRGQFVDKGGYTYLKIPLGLGRGMTSAYSWRKYGFQFGWKPVRIGAWWDKYMAVMALGDPYTTFYGVDTSGDMSSYFLNFNTLFGRYVNNLIGGFILNQPKQYGPLLNAQGELQYRDPIKLNGTQGIDASPTYQGMSLDPNEQYTAQYYAGFLGAVYFSADVGDQYFNESMKIAVKGRAESPDVPQDVRNDPKRYVELMDPGSSRLYYAVRVDNQSSYFNTEPSYFSMGYEYLKSIKAKYYQADGRKLKSGVERWELESDFQFINVIMSWLRAGEYNRVDEEVP